MASIRRTTRKRADSRNTIEACWDAGAAPPPEAGSPEHRGSVLACVFFRWAEVRPAWGKGHHPHLRDWLAALG